MKEMDSLESDEKRGSGSNSVLSTDRFFDDLKKSYHYVKLTYYQPTTTHVIIIEPNFHFNQSSLDQLEDLFNLHHKRLSELLNDGKLVILLDVDEVYKDHQMEHISSSTTTSYCEHFKNCHCVIRRLYPEQSMLYKHHNVHSRYYITLLMYLYTLLDDVTDICKTIVYSCLHSMYDKGEFVKRLSNSRLYDYIEYRKRHSL
jgi:hypothetical protein